MYEYKELFKNMIELKIGDKIFVEQAWEDEAGNFHDEYAYVKAINTGGRLELDFFEATAEVKEFLKDCDWEANDFMKI